MPCAQESGDQPICHRAMLGTGQNHAQSSVLCLLAQPHSRRYAISLDLEDRIKHYRASAALSHIDYDAVVQIPSW
jgi:hypothetical protein